MRKTRNRRAIILGASFSLTTTSPNIISAISLALYLQSLCHILRQPTHRSHHHLFSISPLANLLFCQVSWSMTYYVPSTQEQSFYIMDQVIVLHYLNAYNGIPLQLQSKVKCLPFVYLLCTAFPFFSVYFVC